MSMRFAGRGRQIWVAHASRVLVSASRRNDLSLAPVLVCKKRVRKSPRPRERVRQHTRRVGYPDRASAGACA